MKASYLKERVVTAGHQVTRQLNVVVQSEEGWPDLDDEFLWSFSALSCHFKQHDLTYAQKSSTVSNLEMRRRFACHVLLLSFLKNHSAHLDNQNKKLLSSFWNWTHHSCYKPAHRFNRVYFILIKQTVSNSDYEAELLPYLFCSGCLM